MFGMIDVASEARSHELRF